MKIVLFACVHNAGRSQMAAAWFNALAGPSQARAVSAGTEPGSRVHPEVLTAMAEVGLDLSGATPQRLTDELASTAALLVTMGCGEACPVVPGLRREDWPLDDPKGQPVERVREIRDAVRAHVVELVSREGWARAKPSMVGTTVSREPVAVNLKTKQDLEGFQWLYEPKSWSVTEKGLAIAPDSGSDFWQRTHYGFRNDNAHFFYKEIEGDFEMYASVSFDGKHRFDQAGLCVRLDEDNWIKTSAEYETEEFSHLGAVVTNLGYSDWSTQEIPADVKQLEYKIVRKGQDFEMYARFEGKDFQQIRIAHLHKNESKVKAGMYTCSPTQGGYSALFTRFELKGVQK